jgi:molybdenum cofactor synthesis domain-containing protein
MYSCSGKGGSGLRKVEARRAIGMVLAHDITEIVPGKKKDVAFKRGSVIREEDLERLLALGRKYVYVLEGEEAGLHEEEAAQRIARAVSDCNMEISPPREGRVNILSKTKGLFLVNRETLFEINRVKDVLLSTAPSGLVVQEGDLVAAARIVPLYIPEGAIRRVEEIAGEGVLRIRPFRHMRAGLVVTGDEVAFGRVKDGSSIVEPKLSHYGLEVISKRIVPDDVEAIRRAICELFEEGADIVVTTAGLSVDPDDVTKEGIEATGAEIIFYGTPIFPGAMLLLARLNGRYIVGAPACVYHDPATALDVVLARIAAQETIGRQQIVELAHGGLCLRCKPCHYPRCPFGKGMSWT